MGLFNYDKEDVLTFFQVALIFSLVIFILVLPGILVHLTESKWFLLGYIPIIASFISFSFICSKEYEQGKKKG